jgi:diguanylate cyclase (GGDEF)-like protein/PAS domain S-box-containing protein
MQGDAGPDPGPTRLSGPEQSGVPGPDIDAGALLHAILDNSTLGFVLVDHLGCIAWGSPALVDLLGYDASDWIGHSVLEWVHPDDSEAALTSLRRVTSGETSGEPLVLRGRHIDGSWRWLEALTRVVTEPERVGAMVSLRDITRRIDNQRMLAENEARLRAFLDHSKDLTVLVDDAGTITWVSGNVEEITGYTPDELQGSYAFDLVTPDTMAEALERFAGVLAHDDPTPMVLAILRKDGSTIPVEALGTILRDASGADGDILVNVRDIHRRVEAEEAFRASEARFRTVVEHSYDVVAVVDEAGTIKWVTDNSVRLLGWEPAEVVGRSGLDLVHPDDLGLMLSELGDFVGGQGVPNPTTIKMLHKDGGWHHVELVGTDLLDNPDIAGIVLNLRGVDERVAAQQDRLRLLHIFGITTDLVGISTVTGELVYLNDAGLTFFGIDSADEVDRSTLERHFTEVSWARIVKDVHPALERDGIWSGELELVRADGTIVPMLAQMVAHREADGRAEYMSGVYRDISERHAFELRLQHEATHDPLTGLPNRTLLLDRLGLALARAARRDTDVGVLFCDLDHFKVVNDSLGHSAGDRLLVDIAQRLQEQLRPGDTVSRFGGDEFVILCEDLAHIDEALVIAERVNHAVSRSFDLDGDEVHVGLSTGIAVSKGADGDPEALIRDADAAMYRAKANGRNRYQVFESDMWAQAVDRFDLEKALRRALRQDELELYYQPIIDLHDGQIRQVEALLRWHHPTRGLLGPDEFISVAEETGVIVPIGLWVLDEACSQRRRWAQALPDLELSMAVNLSGRQLAHPDLIDEVIAVIERSGVDPTLLDLEITESVLMDDAAHSQEWLGRLRTLGVCLSVDDFGTGYSSLSYLKRFPVDRLKVDRSFIDGLGTDPEDTAIVAATINLAHSLGLQATAEGVETLRQREALADLGCDRAQGFLLGRPAPVDEVSATLHAACASE